MRFASRLNQFSIGLAVLSFISAGVASAQTLKGVNARLVQTLDSKSASVGQAVTAKLQGSLKADSGLDLPRGSELLGKISAVEPSSNGSASTLTIEFTAAKLRNGKEVPVRATVLAAYNGDEGQDEIGPAPDSVGPEASVTQSPGALSGVSLSSSAKNAASATFTRTNGDIRLNSGTWLQLGVGPSSSAASTSAAE